MKTDKNIPIPPKGKPKNTGRKPKYPILELNINDSFLIPFEKGRLNHEIQSRAWGTISNFRKKHPERKFTTRLVNHGVRVWRTK